MLCVTNWPVTVGCFVVLCPTFHLDANGCSVCGELLEVKYLVAIDASLHCNVVGVCKQSGWHDSLHAWRSHTYIPVLSSFVLAPISCYSPSLQFINKLLSCTVGTAVPHRMGCRWVHMCTCVYLLYCVSRHIHCTLRMYFLGIRTCLIISYAPPTMRLELKSCYCLLVSWHIW